MKPYPKELREQVVAFYLDLEKTDKIMSPATLELNTAYKFRVSQTTIRTWVKKHKEAEDFSYTKLNKSDIFDGLDEDIMIESVLNYLKSAQLEVEKIKALREHIKKWIES